MALIFRFFQHRPRFSISFTIKQFKFNSSFSTCVFPPTLSTIFSELPAKSVPTKENPQAIRINAAEHTKTKKAHKTAGIINDKPWSPQTESHLSTLTPLSQTTFFQVLRRIKTPSKALEFFKWAQDSGFNVAPQGYFMILEILGKARNLNLARNFLYSIPKKSNNTVPLTDKFFNSLIRSYGDAALFQESLKVFETMKSMGISPSTVTFNNLFSILMKKGRVGMVFDLYDEMLKTFGVKPDVYTFNLLIRGFCINSKVDEAFRMFNEMEKFGCEPDLITFNTILDGLCRIGKVSIARNVLNGMRKKGENLRPNVVSYTTLIRGYCEKQEINKALSAYREMVHSKIKPSEMTYNTIVQGLCESQNFDMVKEIFGEHVGFVPDTCTFNTLINAHCSRGNLEEALKVFKKMKELHVKQDSATYSVLIQSLCRDGNFGKAQSLLDELFQKEILLHDDGCKPLVASYNLIFKYLCENGKTAQAERIFRQLIKRGIQDPSACETLILGNCKEEAFVKGHKLLILMLRSDFLPNLKIYQSLIDGLLQKEEPCLAYDTLEKMLRSQYIPRTSIFHRVLLGLLEKGFAHESVGLLTSMLEKDIRTNLNLSTDTVRILFKHSLKDEAFQLVRSLYEKGYLINMKEVILFLCEDNKPLEAYELLVFSLKNDMNADEDICSTVLSGLCKVGKLSEAFQLYYELLEKGVKQPLNCLEDLKNCLETDGRLKEAEFVAKRMIN